MMQRITIGEWEFRYIVGPYTVGIITPTRKKHVATITEIRAAATGPAEVQDGTPDWRVTPEDIAQYVVANQLK
jgi:hypothetical protein